MMLMLRQHTRTPIQLIQILATVIQILAKNRAQMSSPTTTTMTVTISDHRDRAIESCIYTSSPCSLVSTGPLAAAVDCLEYN